MLKTRHTRSAPPIPLDICTVHYFSVQQIKTGDLIQGTTLILSCTEYLESFCQCLYITITA